MTLLSYTQPTTKMKHLSNDNSSQLELFDLKNSEKLPLLNRRTFQINKPLVPLKISLFLWHGAASFLPAFQTLFLKQRGITIAQLSLINIVTTLVQCFGPALSELIAGKIGKSKHVLFANFALNLLFLNSLILIPPAKAKNREFLECNFDPTKKLLPVINNSSVARNCTLQCVNDGMYHELLKRCSNWNDTLCGTLWYILEKTSGLWNPRYGEILLKDVEIDIPYNAVPPWCITSMLQNCVLECRCDGSSTYQEDNTTTFVPAFFLLILFKTTLSNCFRFMDLTSRSMVKAHNSDFEKERIWCVISTIILSPLCGYLVQLHAFKHRAENYLMAFYLFDVLVLVNMIIVWKLDVQINPPGEIMWNKMTFLLKKADFIAFIFAVLIMGTNWGFVKVFTVLHLDDLGAPTMVLAMLPAVSAVVALPFLLSANWWVEKIGCNKLLFLGFAAYIITDLGYSFMIDPWLSLVLEMLTVFTYHLLWVAIVCRSNHLAPEGLAATVIATADSIHHGIGNGTGSLTGGFVMSRYGGRYAFQVMACIAATTALLYGFFLYVRGIRKDSVDPEESVNCTTESYKESGENSYKMSEKLSK